MAREREINEIHTVKEVVKTDKVKNGTRLYINLTDKCNVSCPFCCMYSSPDKNKFITFEQFKKIIDECKTEFELQLEGGEPLLHRDLFLFIEYAIYTGRCVKIIVLTNGILLSSNMNRFIDVANWHNVKIEFKISVNYYLLNEGKKLGKDRLKEISDLVFATKYIPNINILLNVRKRHFGDDWIEKELDKYDLKGISNIFYLQSYGKLKDSKEYDKPVIVQNIENWKIFASDGTCFGQDLIARSEYEK